MTLYLVLHIGVSNLVANPKLHPNASYTRLPNIPAALRAWQADSFIRSTLTRLNILRT